MGAYLNPKLLTYNERKSGLSRFGGTKGDVSYTIWTHLNATAHIHFYHHDGFVNEKGLPQSYLSDLVSGQIEFAMNMNLLHLAFDPKDWLAIGSVSSFLIVVFKYLMRLTMSKAILELFRMLMSIPTFLKPDNLLTKSLFMIFFLLTMVINMYFQSKLTSYDVVPKTNPTINTKDDLIKSRVPVYGSISYNEFLSDLNIGNRYHYVEYGKCSNLLLEGNRVICVTTCHEARLNAFEKDSLHVSEEFRRLSMSFSMTEDWPLQSKFNLLLRRLSEVACSGSSEGEKLTISCKSRASRKRIM